MRKLNNYKEAEKGVVCHVSELAEFLEEVKWNEYSLKAKVLASLYGLEPARVEANARVGEVVDLLEVPYQAIEPVPLSKGLHLLHERAMVVKRNERYFVEPAFLSENGFKVLARPEDALKSLREELEVPFLVVKETPFHCCWTVAPLLGCAKYYSAPGEVAGGRLLEAPIMRGFPSYGCWEVELEWGECFYGFPGYLKGVKFKGVMDLIAALRYGLWKLLPWPREWGPQKG